MVMTHNVTGSSQIMEDDCYWSPTLEWSISYFQKSRSELWIQVKEHPIRTYWHKKSTYFWPKEKVTNQIRTKDGCWCRAAKTCVGAGRQAFMSQSCCDHRIIDYLKKRIIKMQIQIIKTNKYRIHTSMKKAILVWMWDKK